MQIRHDAHRARDCREDQARAAHERGAFVRAGEPWVKEVVRANEPRRGVGQHRVTADEARDGTHSSIRTRIEGRALSMNRADAAHEPRRHPMDEMGDGKDFRVDQEHLQHRVGVSVDETREQQCVDRKRPREQRHEEDVTGDDDCTSIIVGVQAPSVADLAIQRRGIEPARFS